MSFRCITTLSLSLITAVLACSVASADRPGSPELLPASTLAFVRVRNAREMVEKFQETSAGRMFQDEEIKPMVDHLYGSAEEAYGEVEERIGLSLNDLLSLPQGEISIALVAPEEGPPAVALLFEAGENVDTALTLLNRGEERAAQDGIEKKTQKIGDVTLNLYEGVGPQNRTICQFEKDGVIGITSDLALAEVMLNIWAGKDTDIKTLADNDEFNTIMSKCKGSKDEPPQLAFYFDPIGIARTVSRGNLGAQTAMAILPALGLDGLKGIGGSMILAPEEFDSVVHMHVSLDNPRAGAIEAIAMESGDPTPEAWVPDDVVSYTTIYWDLEKTWDKSSTLYDSFTDEGRSAGEVERRISTPLGVDFIEDILMEIDGRATYITWIEPPARINSQTNFFAIRVKDRKSAKKTLDKLMSKYSDRFEERTYAGVSYYYDKEAPDFEQRRRERIEERGGDLEQPRLSIRRPEPCIGLMDDYIFASDSVGFMEHVINTKGRPKTSLANNLEYKAIASKIRRHSGTGKPGMVRFERPDAALKNLYDMAADDNTRSTLSGAAEGNRFFKALDGALTDNPLPEFSVMQKYFAPTGALVTNDDTGIHYMGFVLRNETEEKGQ